MTLIIAFQKHVYRNDSLNPLKMIADIETTEKQIINFIFCWNKLTINKITAKTKETKTEKRQKNISLMVMLYTQNNSKLYQLPYNVYSLFNKRCCVCIIVNIWLIV